jgi:hypothetical protein
MEDSFHSSTQLIVIECGAAQQCCLSSRQRLSAASSAAVHACGETCCKYITVFLKEANYLLLAISALAFPQI